jgi:hypothetical protein
MRLAPGSPIAATDDALVLARIYGAPLVINSYRFKEMLKRMNLPE